MIIFVERDKPYRSLKKINELLNRNFVNFGAFVLYISLSTLLPCFSHTMTNKFNIGVLDFYPEVGNKKLKKLGQVCSQNFFNFSPNLHAFLLKKIFTHLCSILPNN